MVAISTRSPSLETELFASSRPPVRQSVHPSVCIYQRGSKCTDFREIWYWGLLWKYVEKIQKWVKPGKNIWHLIRSRRCVFLFLAKWNSRNCTLFEWLWYQAASPSVCRSVRRGLKLQLFPWNLLLGISTKICREMQSVLTIGQKYQALYMQSLYGLLLLLATLNRYNSAIYKWNGIRLLERSRKYTYYTNVPQSYIISI